MPRKAGAKRRVCFVSGTRAEFGLMASTLQAIRSHPYLRLQIVCTGMHLDPGHGRTVDSIRAQGWRVDAEVPWDPGDGSPGRTAEATGTALAALAAAFRSLRTEVVLVVGDRVEAFAAAAAAHVSQVPLAHVHGGDRALGQVDDSLRHAISKLAHVHFPATRQSAERLKRLGEDRWRIRRVGSPGVDGIRAAAAAGSELAEAFPVLTARRYALVVLHPTGPESDVEFRRARMVISAVERSGTDHAVVVYPNNDPGSRGIVRCWESLAKTGRLVVRRDVPRPLFLGLMRDAAVVVGNSSSGIIEAASFGTPVVDIGPRQAGRERGPNVTNVPFARPAIEAALKHVWHGGRPVRSRAANVYGGGGAGRRIADALARISIDARFLRKLIAY